MKLFQPHFVVAAVLIAAADACRFCPCGFYCPDIVTPYKSPIVCPVGFFCPEGQPDQSTEPIPCPAGMLCNVTGLCAPERCPCGFTCPATCPAPKKPPPKPSTPPPCRQCPPGMWVKQFCQNDCVNYVCGPCLPGRYCPFFNTSMLLCPGGSFCPSGSSAPTLCPAGSYCPRGVSGPAACPNGTTSPAGSKTIDACKPGVTPATTPPPAACTILPVPCKAGHYCPFSGPPTKCPAGHYCPEGTCAPLKCRCGHKCPEGSASETPCQPPFYCPAAGADKQTLCPLGFACPFPAMCAPLQCGPGSFVSCSGKARCDPCPAGRYCPETDKSTLCPPGHFCPAGASAPAECPAGSYCRRGSAVPTPCPPHTTSLAGAFSKAQCTGRRQLDAVVAGPAAAA